jgi:Nif-specific regulatory protein
VPPSTSSDDGSRSPLGDADAAIAGIASLRGERDLYRKLLDLGVRTEIEPFLAEALSLIVEVTRARRGYIEVAEPQARDEAPFWMAHGCYDEEVEEIREAFSRGVIAEALAGGKTIVTASALQDPRFLRRSSVQRKQIEAVLCAPIGEAPPLGVLYLQGRSTPGPFTEDDRLRAETFTRHLAAFADRLLIRARRRDEADPTTAARRTLKADDFVGRSKAVAKVLQQVALASPLDVGVLLTGPSGSGKTQIARILHDSGPRAAGPFVELNCSALPENLIESELFGALPGAHSTATKRVVGKVAAAEKGTLFLDEIGEMALSAQAKLLQLLQSKEYYPLGSPKAVQADVRIVAASNIDLKAAASKKTFREDLLYRLQVLAIRMPSLSERREDIAELCEHFAEHAAEAQRLPAVRPSVGALRAAEAATWPGNVRQLAHAVESAVIRAAGEGVLLFERTHLFPEADVAPDARLTFQQETRRFQEQLLRGALADTGWNILETAALLDLGRSQVYNLIRAFGIERQPK